MILSKDILKFGAIILFWFLLVASAITFTIHYLPFTPTFPTTTKIASLS